jgi:hypothetical protein
VQGAADVCNLQKVMRFQAFSAPLSSPFLYFLSRGLSASQIGLAECMYRFGPFIDGENSGSKTARFHGRGVLARAGLIGFP